MSCSDTTPEKIEQLRVGMSQDEAIELLGEPYTKQYKTYGCLLKYTYYSGKKYDKYRQSLYVHISNGKVDRWY